MPIWGESYSLAEVGFNDFWSRRTAKQIIRLDILRSLYDPRNEFGVEVFIDGAESFVVEYADESGSFDQLRVTGPYTGPQCDRVRVF
jgi:hypothetical protein